MLVSPVLQQFEKHTDPVTGCVLFKLFPIGKNKNPIIKTTFPQNWTVDDIYQSLVDSKFIDENSEGDLSIVTGEIQKNPKIKVKLVFKPEGTFNRLITAMPIVEASLNSPVSPFKPQVAVASPRK